MPGVYTDERPDGVDRGHAGLERRGAEREAASADGPGDLNGLAEAPNYDLILVDREEQPGRADPGDQVHNRPLHPHLGSAQPVGCAGGILHRGDRPPLAPTIRTYPDLYQTPGL